MKTRRHIPVWGLALTVSCAVAAMGRTPKKPAPKSGSQTLPTLSAREIFKRVSPSVMVVESLDAQGKATTLGSGVVIAPGVPTRMCVLTEPTSL